VDAAWRQAAERAGAFVLARGTELERLRARALLGEVPAAEVVRAFVASGALAATEPEALVGSLAALDDLRQLAAPELEPALRALGAALGPDGAWGDPAEPLAERIVRTAHLGGFLTKSLRARPRVRAAVDAFLCRTFDAERARGGDFAAIAAWAHWFSLNESEVSDPALQWCGRELERGFRTRACDALRTARVFVLCHAIALPGASLTGRELCQALAAEQTADGGFALSASALSGAPVEAALEALAAFAHLGR
jgi:hypothetical protein